MMTSLSQRNCPHLSIGFMELHDGAIKIFCDDCGFAFVLHQEDEQSIRRIFFALQTQRYL